MTLRQGTLEDLATYCELNNTIWPDHKRDLPGIVREYEVLPPEKQTTFWFAEENGVPIGFLECYRYSGSYHPLKWLGSIGVLPEYRRQGIGSSLYDTALDFITGHDAISLMTRVSDADPDSMRFALSRGFEEVKRDFESVLHLEKVDPALLEEMSRSDARIVPASELDSPEFRREWHLVFEDVRHDTPRSAPPTPMSFEELEYTILNDPLLLWQASQIALLDGKLVGFSALYETEEPGELFQWLTAVQAPYRGRHIAQALKSRLTKWAIENGYQRIRTDNDTRNGPMLAINVKLGYERMFGMATMIKTLSS